MSMKQHFNMHFKTKPTGIIDDIKRMLFKIIKERMYYLDYNEKVGFRLSDIEIAIGTGGVISNASKAQAIFIMIESLQMTCITELWRDKHFISPHLGVLSDVDQGVAEDLIYSECIEKLAVYVKYLQVLKIKIIDASLQEKVFEINDNDVFYFVSDVEVKVVVDSIFNSPSIGGCRGRVIHLDKDIPLIIDTRNAENNMVLLERLKAYDVESFGFGRLDVASRVPTRRLDITTTHTITAKLPFNGTIHVNPGDNVTPDTLIGENKYDPPNLYVILIPSALNRTMNEEEIRTGLLVKVDDKVSIGDRLFKNKEERYYIRILGAFNSVIERDLTEDEIHDGILDRLHEYVRLKDDLFMINDSGRYLVKYIDTAFSPVRGIIDKIDCETGIIIIREIQDYPLEPVEIDVAKELNENNNTFVGFMKKKKGDFIRNGEALAEKHNPQSPVMLLLDPEYAKRNSYRKVISPFTGTVKDINTKTGIVTICYDINPHRVYALCYGQVDRIVDDTEVFITIQAVKIEGKIGFGGDVGGILLLYDSKDHLSLRGNEAIQRTQNIIIYINHVNFNDLKLFEKKGIKGLICNTISYSCLKKYLGKDIGVALTGNEDIPFSLIILHGLSSDVVDDGCIDFSDYAGKYVLLKPNTQIRAGATRPSLYIQTTLFSS